jgi:hypothetical protein
VYGDDFEYFPGNKSVQFVFARSGDTPVKSHIRLVSEYSASKAPDAAYARVSGVTSERLGTNEFGGGSGDERITIRIIGQSPAVSVSELVEPAPRHATVELTINGYTNSYEFPVYTSHIGERLSQRWPIVRGDYE